MMHATYPLLDLRTADGTPLTGAARDAVSERIHTGWGQQDWSRDRTRVTMRCPFSKMFTTFLVDGGLD